MKRKTKRITRFRIVFTILLIILAVTAVFVDAAYIVGSSEVINTFKPADSVNPTINETFDNVVKEDVYFEVGDTYYPVYVRAAIVVTWQDEAGTVYYEPPVATGDDPDYSIVLNTDDWAFNEDDGFYYFKNSVVSGGETSILIYSCTQDKEAPEDGYTLSVEIIVQTVQAVGFTDDSTDENKTPAWEDASWSVPQ